MIGPHVGCRLRAVRQERYSLPVLCPAPTTSQRGRHTILRPSCGRTTTTPTRTTPSPRIWTTPGAFCHARAAILDEKRVEKPGNGYQRTRRLKVTAVPASVNSRFRASDCNDWVLAQCHKSSALCQNPFLVMLLPNSSLLRSQPLITNWWAADVSQMWSRVTPLNSHRPFVSWSVILSEDKPPVQSLSRS